MNDASKNPTPSSRSSALTLTNPKASGLSFRANVSWALIGSLVHSFANWATLLVLARVSDPETVGTFALAAAISGPFFTFFNGQLQLVSLEWEVGHELAFTALGFGELTTDVLDGVRTLPSVLGLTPPSPWPLRSAFSLFECPDQPQSAF